MPKEFSRTDRLGAQLQRELAVLVRNELDDPRVRNLTIAEVRVSRDLSHARVYVSSLLQDPAMDEGLQALRHAGGHLRHLLGKALRLRIVPELKFVRDEAAEEGARIDALLEGAADGTDRETARGED